MATLSPSTTKQDYYSLVGGLNLMAPALQIDPGFLIDCLNYEPEVLGGYRRINGFERYDGRPSPSQQTYWLIETTAVGNIVAGNTVNGQTSGATGIVLQVNGTTELVITKLTGVFVTGENIRVGVAVKGVSTSGSQQGAASTPLLDATYRDLAATNYRTDILIVPGSGAILGVKNYNDKTYAFRANAGATAVIMYVATAAGWSAINLGYQVSFTAGSVSPVEGAVITQGANTATVARVVLESGTFAGGTAAGRLILTAAPAPGNFGAGALTGGGTATLSGAATAITLAVGANQRYEFDKGNFTGALATYRMYGCDGVNPEFEFDGTVYVPLNTGSPVRANYVKCHQNQLCFLMGPSFQNSGTGTPYNWTALGGAAEIALGDLGTGMQIQAGFQSGGALAIWTRGKTLILYGTSSANWQLVTFSTEVGAQGYTAQNLGTNAMYQDNRGISVLQTVQAFGNFVSATISQLIQSLINSKSGKTTASSIKRGRNQYRIYCNSGGDTTSIILGMQGSKLLGFTLFDYGKIVRCVTSDETSTGAEIVLFGSDDGYVYQAEMGTSFDGQPIQYWLTLPYTNSGTPRMFKQYRAAQFEIASEGYGFIQWTTDLDYSDPDSPESVAITNALTPGGGKWDSGIVWDQFYWDSAPVQPVQIDLDGVGCNISFTLYGKSTIVSPHVIQSNQIDYSPRRFKR